MTQEPAQSWQPGPGEQGQWGSPSGAHQQGQAPGYEPFAVDPLTGAPMQPHPPAQPYPPTQLYPAAPYPSAPYPSAQPDPPAYPQPYPDPYPQLHHPQPYYPPQHYGGYPSPYGWGARRLTTNGFAIASLVLGVIWIYWLGSVLALVFGLVARSQIRRTGEGGDGMAIAGIVLGLVGMATLLLLVVLVAVNGSR
ncbi:DUF4190 domain-containing protein [Actinomycetes bacterium KLBMP 9759]